MRVTDRGSITTVHHRCSITISTQALGMRKSKGLAPLEVPHRDNLIYYFMGRDRVSTVIYLQPAALLLLGRVMHTSRTSPGLHQSSVTYPHPAGKLPLLTGLDSGKLLCHRSMCPTSACPREHGQDNQKALLTPLPTVTKTPFPSLQRGRNFWKVLPRLQITSTYSVSPEPHKLKMLTATHLPASLCHSVTVEMSLKQKLPKNNSPPDAPQITHTSPRGDIDLRCFEPPTFQKGSAPFHLSPLHMKLPRCPKAKQRRFCCCFP